MGVRREEPGAVIHPRLPHALPAWADFRLDLVSYVTWAGVDALSYKGIVEKRFFARHCRFGRGRARKRGCEHRRHCDRMRPQFILLHSESG